MTAEEADACNEQLMRAYHFVFGSPDGKIVLADLAAYCGARKSTFDPDARMHAHNEGKRDVFLRIQEFSTLSLDEIYALRGIARPAQKPDGEEE